VAVCVEVPREQCYYAGAHEAHAGVAREDDKAEAGGFPRVGGKDQVGSEAVDRHRRAVTLDDVGAQYREDGAVTFAEVRPRATERDPVERRGAVVDERAEQELDSQWTVEVGVDREGMELPAGDEVADQARLWVAGSREVIERGIRRLAADTHERREVSLGCEARILDSSQSLRARVDQSEHREIARDDCGQGGRHRPGERVQATSSIARCEEPKGGSEIRVCQPRHTHRDRRPEGNPPIRSATNEAQACVTPAP
jgi:hypothetical protein